MSNPDFSDHALTVEEYLQLEERGRLRHEFVAGEVYAMTGGTLRHNKIAGNIFARLRAAAAGGLCQVFINDVKVRAAEDLFYYPDVVVACDGIADADVYLREPCLIVEVTSPSSAGTDRREKLVAYRQIGTLGAYLVVDQRRRRVERHARDAAGAWRREEITGDGTVQLAFPATSLSLEEIYEGVALPTVGEPEPADYEV